jgi:hypothetical protein
MGIVSEPGHATVPRWRNAVGMLLLVAGLCVYALAAMLVGATLVPSHWLAQLAFFVVAGLVWLWPARRLLAWMARDD